VRVMARLNMTLSEDTEKALARYAKRLKLPLATVARTVLCEGLAQRESAERKQQLARDYAAGRADAADMLEEIADFQVEWPE
jgi:hypothetical protein